MASMFRRRANKVMAEAEAPADAITRNVVEMSRLSGALSKMFKAIREGKPPEIDMITMRDVVEFLVTHHDQAGGRPGAAVRQEHPDGLLVWLGFLNRSGEPLTDGPTRTYLAGSLDPELEAHFGTRAVIIFS